MTATPGQAAYEAWHRRYTAHHGEDAYAMTWDRLASRERDWWADVEHESWAAIAAHEPHAAPGVWTVAECLERIGDLAGALHEIKTAYTPGTYAHDLAHATLDRSAPDPQPAPGPDVCECGHAWAHHAFSDDVCAVAGCPCTRPRPAPQPAPELAAAMRETASRELAAAMAESRHYREALQQVAKHHDDAITQVRIIAKIAKRALEGK